MFQSIVLVFEKKIQFNSALEVNLFENWLLIKLSQLDRVANIENFPLQIRT